MKRTSLQLLAAVAVLGLVSAPMIAPMRAQTQANYNVKNRFATCTGANCDNAFNVYGTQNVQSGGVLDVKTGGVVKVNGTDYTAGFIAAVSNATSTIMGYLTSITPGTAAASKALVVDANTAISGHKIALGGGLTATLAGTAVGGLTDITNATSSTTQNTEYTLNSITLPASALNASARAVEVTAFGTLAGNANAKNVKIYFGGTAVATVTGSTANGKDYVATMRCVRLSLSSQSCQASVMIDTGTSATMAVASPSETETAPIIIALKTANTAAAASSGTGKGMIVHFIN